MGIRNAALNASAASDCRPKKCENALTRSRPRIRLAKIPAPTEAAGCLAMPMARRSACRARPAGDEGTGNCSYYGLRIAD